MWCDYFRCVIISGSVLFLLLGETTSVEPVSFVFVLLNLDCETNYWRGNGCNGRCLMVEFQFWFGDFLC